MKMLLLGAEGQLGRALVPVLSRLGVLSAPSRGVLDICDDAALRRTVADAAPDLIVNAAAYTDVDRSESDDTLAFHVNAEALGPLAGCTGRRT